jgi:hypothetical protein
MCAKICTGACLDFSLDLPQIMVYFLWHQIRGFHMSNLREKIENRLEQEGRGYVCTRKDFQDFGPAGTIGKLLFRMVEEGLIRRLGRGLFDYPSVSLSGNRRI